ncbi:MAG: hypothetical protein AABY32_04950 [Nanoarchaeota archaeon]
MEKERIIELSLALAFIGILLLVSIIVLSNNEREDEEAISAKVINTYNIYGDYSINYNLIDSTPYLHSTYYKNEEKRFHLTYLEYEGQKTREEFLGNYVQEYYVYILNKERAGRYFTVVFEFEDKNGYEYSESITQYLRAGEKKKFAYRDIQSERNEIVDWDYEVIPEKD